MANDNEERAPGGARRSEDEVGVAVDKAGRDPASPAVDPFDGIGIRRKIGLRTRINDAAAARGDHALFDLAEIGTVGP